MGTFLELYSEVEVRRINVSICCINHIVHAWPGIEEAMAESALNYILC